MITNTGNVDLRVTQFVDDQLGTITACAEDVPGTPVFPVVLDPTDSVTCTVTGVDAADFGQYANLADVTGTPLDENGDVITENQTPAGPVPVVAADRRRSVALHRRRCAGDRHREGDRGVRVEPGDRGVRSGCCW